MGSAETASRAATARAEAKRFLQTAALLAMVVFLSGCAGRGLRPDELPDYRAPLALQSVGPTPYQHRALYDRPVLINFFSTWCFPCLGQLPYLGELQKEFGPQGLAVVTVGMDNEGAKVLQPFVEQSPQPFPVLVADEKIRKGETVFGAVRELPTTVILDREGKVVAAWPGIANADEVRKAVQEAVAP